jgi:acetolactate synthase I/II/III large subunit
MHRLRPGSATGIPLAAGTARVCDHKVINLQADSGGMYTVQTLWTLARENLNVLLFVLTRSFLIEAVD